MTEQKNTQYITQNNTPQNNDVAVLKKHFAHCFDKVGNFDFVKFKVQLSDKSDFDFSHESYGMDWLGKSYARLLATDEVTTLLKEKITWNQRPENKNSQNLLIQGDNLEVLKHLTHAYDEKIKMIYIDPPYNTGGDGFVYQDDRKFNKVKLSQLAGVEEEVAERILKFTQSKSNSHSAWLTFMYPRLYIAKNLLREDGVIFVSIDENEVAQLRLLMDEVFGEENFVGEIIWNSKYTTSNDAKYLSNQHETLLFYSKLKGDFEIGLLDRTDEQNNSYKNRDSDPKGAWKATPIHAKSGTEDNVYTIDFPNGISWKAPSGRYPRYSKQKLLELFEKNELYFNSKGNVDKKTYLSEVKQGITAGTVWRYDDVGHTHGNNEELSTLIGKGKFDNPKGTKLIKQLCKVANASSGFILDFFAGSGTTADAVMQLNAEDGGNRKYILVQLPESIDKKKNKTAYDFVQQELGVEQPTIFDITQERLIRAAKKIQSDNGQSKEPKNLSGQDFGFKIFTTLPIWENYGHKAETSNQMELFDESKLIDEDLQALLTTWKTYDGVPLTQRCEKINLRDYIAYYVNTENRKKLYLMDKGFDTVHLKNLLEKIDEDRAFNPTTIILFGYNFVASKNLREIHEGIKSYANKNVS